MYVSTDVLLGLSDGVGGNYFGHHHNLYFYIAVECYDSENSWQGSNIRLHPNNNKIMEITDSPLFLNGSAFYLHKE